MTKRIAEFVNYHIHGDGECNNVVLKAWADKHKLNFEQRYELAYFFSITYCVESAIILFEEQRKVFEGVNAWVTKNKASLVFQSDRKYIRMKDSFERCLLQFKKVTPSKVVLSKVMENGTIILSKAIPFVSSWELFGRFSAFLFLETLVELTGISIENTTIDWKNGNTATSGLLNLYGLDNAATTFDKTNKLIVEKGQMDKMLADILAIIASAGGDNNVTKVETSLCAYRKFFKGSRYNGYYLDRMLEEIYAMQNDFPEISKELISIRALCFDKKYLGEIGGWKGIRKDLKKLYIKEGIIS